MKYTIKSPNQKYNGVSASVAFVEGVGETDSDYIAAWFKSKGYKVEADTEVVEEVEKPVEKPLSKMTTAELEAKAAELEADLAGCKNNAERAAKIADALELEE